MEPEANEPAGLDHDTIVEAPDALKTVGDEIIQQLKTVYDPEIPVDIFELGLIYKVKLDDAGGAAIKMTLTSPMCPAAEELPPEVETKARNVEGVTSVVLDLVWDPPWNPQMMSEAAKLELGML
ncbi:MAG: iron-sulfur cluster assembly protein [Myxococcota bacterium]